MKGGKLEVGSEKKATNKVKLGIDFEKIIVIVLYRSVRI